MTCVASSCDYSPCWPPFVSALFYSFVHFSPLCPLPLFPGQISLAPWGQMRRPSWLMCRVTTTRSQASRRWEMKCKKGNKTKQNLETISGHLPKWLAENDSRYLPTFIFWLLYMRYSNLTLRAQCIDCRWQSQAVQYLMYFFIKGLKVSFIWNYLFLIYQQFWKIYLWHILRAGCWF